MVSSAPAARFRLSPSLITACVNSARLPVTTTGFVPDTDYGSNGHSQPQSRQRPDNQRSRHQRQQRRCLEVLGQAEGAHPQAHRRAQPRQGEGRRPQPRNVQPRCPSAQQAAGLRTDRPSHRRARRQTHDTSEKQRPRLRERGCALIAVLDRAQAPPVETNDILSRVSANRLNCFLTCRLKLYFRYVLKLVAPTTGAPSLSAARFTLR